MTGGAPSDRLGRFELRRELGRGGMGIVYEAYDPSFRRVVALKIRGRNRSPQNLKREFRLASDLRHPNLARYYSLEELDGEMIVAMEQVRDATTFVEWCRPEGAFDLERTRAALEQLTEGLAHLHDAGLIHRDIKPSNVLVDPDGRVVVVDFGLTRPNMVDEWGLDASLEGTPIYLAPERALGAPSDARSDFYAVGVMLHEVLTGRLPPAEEAGHLNLLARRVLLDRALFPPAVPDVFIGLCFGLLRSQPDSRTGMPAIRAVLGHAPRRDSPGRTLLGRDSLLERLHASFAAAERSTVVVGLHGPPGIGKTALVERFAREASEAGALVLSGRCREGDGVPYKAFDEVFTQLAQVLDSATPLGSASALIRRASGAPQAGASPRRAAAFSDVRRLLHDLARDRPLAIVLEDQHWRDVYSEALLEAIVRDAHSPAALLLLTGRVPDPLVERWASEGLRASSLELPPLSVIDARALLGRDDPEALRRAAGNPLWLRQLRDGGSDLSAALGGRLGRLSEGALALLRVFALAGAPLEPEIALDLAGADGADLALLHEADLIRVGSHRTGAYEVEHDLVRAEVIRETPQDERRALHLALARNRLQVLPEGDATVVRHLAAAGHEREGAAVAIRAARQAAASLAADVAAELWALALDLGAPDPEAAVRERARALAAAGRTREAARLFQTLARERDVLRAAEIHLGAGRVSEGWRLIEPLLREAGLATYDDSPSIDPGAVRSIVGAAWAAIGPSEVGDPERTRRQVALCFAAGKGLAAFYPNRSAVYFLEGLRRALMLGDRASIARGLSSAGLVLARLTGVASDRMARLCFDRSERLAVEAEDEEVRAWVAGLRGVASVASGRWEEGLEQLDSGLAALSILMDTHWEQMAAATTAMLPLRYLGQYYELERVARALHYDGVVSDDLRVRIEADRFLALVQLVRGDPTQAERILWQSLAEWPTPGVCVQHWNATHTATQIALYTGDAELAREHLESCRLEGTGLRSVQLIRIEHALLRALVAVARGDRAAAERARGALSREGSWATPFAGALALALGIEGPPAEAIAAALRERGMRAHAAALELLHGDDAEAAREQLGVLGVAEPDAFARCLVPGPLGAP